MDTTQLTNASEFLFESRARDRPIHGHLLDTPTDAREQEYRAIRHVIRNQGPLWMQHLHGIRRQPLACAQCNRLPPLISRLWFLQESSDDSRNRSKHI